ncbi:MAG: hypothetical protein PHE83_08145 [Opitutaceae bacterium]|nr:hypothetical protein [Opitutaceae bacterium]
MRTTWPEKVRKHLAIASVGGSTLMMQSGKDRGKNARAFLLANVPLTGLSAMDEAAFLTFLDQRTTELARILPRPDDNLPNWGAARKVLNIYLRLCAMNKDTHRTFNLAVAEPFLEVPLDNDVVEGIDQRWGTRFKRTFKIKTLTPQFSAEIQAAAKRLAATESLYRYELDVLFWRDPTGA